MVECLHHRQAQAKWVKKRSIRNEVVEGFIGYLYGVIHFLSYFLRYWENIKVFKDVRHLRTCMSLKELQSILNTPDLGVDELMKCALGAKTTEKRNAFLHKEPGPLDARIR